MSQTVRIVNTMQAVNTYDDQLDNKHGPFDMVSVDDSNVESFTSNKMDNLMAATDGQAEARNASNTVIQRTAPLTDTDEAYGNFDFE